jgi:hypothetical protein
MSSFHCKRLLKLNLCEIRGGWELQTACNDYDHKSKMAQIKELLKQDPCLSHAQIKVIVRGDQ